MQFCANKDHFLEGETVAGHYFNGFYPLHNHEYWEIIVSCEEITHIYNGEKSVVPPYSVFILRPYSDNHQAIKGNHLSIKIQDSEMQSIANFLSDGFYDALKSPTIPLSLSMISNIGQEILNYHNYVFSTPGRSSAQFISICKMSACNILKYFLLNHISNIKYTDKPAWINDLVQRLQSPEYFSVPLKKIAQDFNYSYMQISRVFKKYIDMGLHEFFIKSKLNYAYNMLVSTNTPIAQVAYKIGYESLGHFTQAFKKVYKISPSECQKLSHRI